MLVQEVMTVPVITIQATASIGEAAEVMLRHGVSGLPVTDADGKLAGIISEGDFLRRAELRTDSGAPPWWMEFFMVAGKAAEDYVRTHSRTVADVMTRDVVTIAPSARLVDAVSLMEKHHVKRLPVLEADRLVGLMTRSDLMRVIARTFAGKPAETAVDDESIRRAVVDEISRQSWSGRGLIHVSVHDGVVDLTGTVYDDGTRLAARVAAENVPGVKSVSERLEWIEPTSGMMLFP